MIDHATLSGLLTLALLLAFCAVAGWAYAPGRRQDFAALAELPLHEDRPDSADAPKGAPR